MYIGHKKINDVLQQFDILRLAWSRPNLLRFARLCLYLSPSIQLINQNIIILYYTVYKNKC